MDSNRLALHWCIETLAESEDNTAPLLRQLILSCPEFNTTAPEIVREKVCLKLLEDLIGFDREKKPSESTDCGENYSGCSVEDVLIRQARKLKRASRLPDGERDGSNLFSDDLRKFILEKRGSFPKSSLNLLREKIQQDSSPALSSLREYASLSNLTRGDFPASFVDSDHSRAKKRLKVNKDCEIQLPVQSSGATKLDNGNGMMQSGPFKTMQELLNLASKRSSLLQVNDICSHQASNLGVGNEISIVNVSNKDCMTSPGSNPTVPLDDCTTKVSQDYHTSSLHHMECSDKIGNEEAGTSTTICHEKHPSKKSSIHKSSGDRNITNSDMTQQPIKDSSCCQATNADGIILQEDSSGLGCSVPKQNMSNGIVVDLPSKGIDRYTDGNLIPDVSLTPRNDGTSEDILVVENENNVFLTPRKNGISEDTLVVENEKNVYLTPRKDGTSEGILLVENEKNLNPGLQGTHGGSISVKGMHGEHEEPIDLGRRDAVSSSERYQPDNDDPVIANWTEQGLCMKCGEAGALLTCNNKGCSVAVHESCLGSPVVFNKSGLFYCPFCSLKRATSVLYKARKEFNQAQNALLAFTGKNCAVDHEEMSPLPRVERVHQQTDVTSDAPKVVSKNQHINVSGADPSILNANNLVTCRKPIAGGENQQHADSCMAKDGNSLIPDDQCNLGERCKTTATEILDDVTIEQNSEHEKQQKNEPEGRTEINKSSGIKQGERVEAEAQETRTLHPISVNRGINNATSSGTGTIVKKTRVKRYTNPLAYPGRRSKLIWSAEEEETLKEGMLKFVTNENENIPWVKILDFGRDVFHKTRQPGDLKDKWRNMKKKLA